MRAGWVLCTVAAGVMLLASACGSSGSGDGSGRATGVTGVPDGAPFIDQANLRFEPNSLTVEQGEVVYFKNSESAIHTVTIEEQNASGTMQKDDIFQWTPPGAGSYEITCDFHPQMKATIEVVESLPEESNGGQSSEPEG